MWRSCELSVGALNCDLGGQDDGKFLHIRLLMSPIEVVYSQVFVKI